jgi:hypothetical protein
VLRAHTGKRQYRHSCGRATRQGNACSVPIRFSVALEGHQLLHLSIDRGIVPVLQVVDLDSAVGVSTDRVGALLRSSVLAEPALHMRAALKSRWYCPHAHPAKRVRRPGREEVEGSPRFLKQREDFGFRNPRRSEPEVAWPRHRWRAGPELAGQKQSEWQPTDTSS